jgi:prepilin-type N-terminal cleavage/methylation domain-containing protein/prepilin-type processing-associated H-X9-DG protein
MQASRSVNCGGVPVWSAARTAAFTLIELLAVLAIIALLAAMLLPALSRAKTQGVSTACKNHLRQMSVALQLYANDNGQRYPYGVVLSGGGFGSTWAEALTAYYPVNWTNRAYHCAGYKGPISTNFNFPGNHAGSYAYNLYGTPAGLFFYNTEAEMQLGLGPWYNPPNNTSVIMSPIPATAESAVAAPSEMFAFADARMENDGNGAWFGDYMMICGLSVQTANVNVKFQWDARHGKTFNFGCCDGHVEALVPVWVFNCSNSAVRWNNDHQPHPETWPP